VPTRCAKRPKVQTTPLPIKRLVCQRGSCNELNALPTSLPQRPLSDASCTNTPASSLPWRVSTHNSPPPPPHTHLVLYFLNPSPLHLALSGPLQPLVLLSFCFSPAPVRTHAQEAPQSWAPAAASAFSNAIIVGVKSTVSTLQNPKKIQRGKEKRQRGNESCPFKLRPRLRRRTRPLPFRTAAAPSRQALQGHERAGGRGQPHRVPR
jgi:hypothetical protein